MQKVAWNKVQDHEHTKSSPKTLSMEVDKLTWSEYQFPARKSFSDSAFYDSHEFWAAMVLLLSFQTDLFLALFKQKQSKGTTTRSRNRLASGVVGKRSARKDLTTNCSALSRTINLNTKARSPHKAGDKSPRTLFLFQPRQCIQI